MIFRRNPMPHKGNIFVSNSTSWSCLSAQQRPTIHNPCSLSYASNLFAAHNSFPHPRNNSRCCVRSTLSSPTPQASSVTDGHLTRISFVAVTEGELRTFSDFTRIPGATFREIELRALAEVLHPFELLDEVSMGTCTALRSLVLCMECGIEDAAPALVGDSHADPTRATLAAYTKWFNEHHSTFPRLAAVRLEMRPAGRRMLTAFVRVAGDTYREWGGHTVQGLLAEEAEQNREVWTSPEDALRQLPLLEHATFVLYERPELDETLTEEAKVELRNVLERRLPTLWRSGAAQLVFETDIVE
ncbi:hypothetical protein LXA43DRAFT_138627 [Ganoderma leucocontextum]|nr:hypothetical protein LXA43DRAFT_138627 [Ganoderma leucocontextum]